MENIFYIATAYRFGDRENHSYIVGLFDDMDTALETATNEEERRAGKYEVEVTEHILNSIKDHKYINKLNDVEIMKKKYDIFKNKG